MSEGESARVTTAYFIVIILSIRSALIILLRNILYIVFELKFLKSLGGLFKRRHAKPFRNKK